MNDEFIQQLVLIDAIGNTYDQDPQIKEIAKKSKASQTEADELVKKIKKGRWSKTKKKLGI